MSEQFQNIMHKLQKTPITQIHLQLTFQAWYRHFNRKYYYSNQIKVLLGTNNGIVAMMYEKFEDMKRSQQKPQIEEQTKLWLKVKNELNVTLLEQFYYPKIELQLFNLQPLGIRFFNNFTNLDVMEIFNRYLHEELH